VLHDRVEIRPFPAGLLPIQVGDDPAGPDGPRMMNRMGRGALPVTVRASNRDVHVISSHLKSKLLTFPGGFSPVDEDQRARFLPPTRCTDDPRRRRRYAHTSTGSLTEGAGTRR
jgi:hypothetical protein